jgi:Phosphoglycerol transferase and related proteins, alkaline phosphatase superfamily
MDRDFLQKTKKIAYYIFFMLITVLGVLISSTVYWLMKTWANLTVDEIVFHLKVPLRGTNNAMVAEAVLTGVIPCVIAIIMAIAVLCLTKKNKKLRVILTNVMMLLSASMAIIMLYRIGDRYNVAEYLKSYNNESDFIEKNYVDPRGVSIKFPSQKRNLIYIYLESMENTFASTEAGGGLKQDIIPELTKLAKENVNFSPNEKLGGGSPTVGTTWTIAAMFAQTAGLPLKIPIYLNAMSEQETFFPDIVTLGDVLAAEGYKQVLMIGSDSVFGGRKNYFTTHGEYEIFDYYTAIERQKIPKDYKEFWGYEDKKLYEYAKEEISSLAEQEQPFNFTMLTVDTHFEDGYLCDLCGREYGDNQYANVIRCASRQAGDFVAWIQEQSFYENTTIVLVGDHLSMDSDFFTGISKENQRQVYNVFINAPLEPVREKNIKFTTIDLFPTTLASLGAKISGERLALGTNLFSGQETLLEQNGLGKMNEEFESKSEFYEQFTKDIVIPGKWLEDEQGWRYQNHDGSYKSGISEVMGNRLYHFDDNGYMISYEEIEKEY